MNYEKLARANGWITQDFGTVSRPAKADDNLEGPGEFQAKMVFVDSWKEACEHDGLVNADPKSIITYALFTYNLGRAGTDKKKKFRPWGIEHSEGRAEAVIEALLASGWSFCQATQLPKSDLSE